MRGWPMVLVVVTLASVRTSEAEFCGTMGLDAAVLTPANTRVPGDGGILVGAVLGGRMDPADAANRADWRFVSAGTTSVPKRTQLAPGLVVYSARMDGAVQLVDETQKVVGSAFITRRARPALAAPAIAWSVQTENSVNVGVELASLPPAEAVAIVLFGKDGKPRSWGLVEPKVTAQVAFRQVGCQMQAPGTQVSAAGDVVTFAYVDAYGRTSPPTKPITIVSHTPADKAVKRPSPRP